MTITSALGRQRQEDWEFEASLSYTVRPCLKKPRAGGVVHWWTSMHEALDSISSIVE
jgi:hypothetical protein